MGIVKISNDKYLENILHTAKLELKELEVKHRIEIAIYEARKEILRKQIDSIELQLEL